VLEGDDDLSPMIDERHVVDTDTVHPTTVDLPIGGRHDGGRGAIFDLDESIPQGAAPYGHRARRILFGVEGLIKAVTQRPTETLEIRVTERVHGALLAPGPSGPFPY
jgi:hypothetical protein